MDKGVYARLGGREKSLEKWTDCMNMSGRGDGQESNLSGMEGLSGVFEYQSPPS
jgi:hypothetical protein